MAHSHSHSHDHAHDHGHHHHHHTAAGAALVFALSLTLGFALVELIGGLWAQSLALIGDAGHMASDAIALGLAAFAAWLSSKPPSRRHSYGMLRAEIVAALVNSLFMLVVVGTVVMAAIDRLQNPRTVDAPIVMLIAFIGLVVNLIVAWVLMRGEQSMNVRGALLHVFGDLLGSVAAIISGVVIYFTGWMLIDPLLSIAICGLILVSTLRLLKEVLNVIMEGVPLHIDYERVGKAMAGVDSVVSVHDLHIWTLASGKIALSAHVVLRDMGDWQTVLHATQHVLHDDFDIEHITLQPELVAADVFVPVSEIGKLDDSKLS